jgi:4'-phosphopantetheinyl transferase
MAGSCKWKFNISHSDDLVLFAFALGRPVGIDIERVDESIDGPSLAQIAFRPEECRQILQLPAELRKMAFYRGWTRNEAYGKLLGTGLALPLDFMPPLASCQNAQDPSGCILFDLSPRVGFVGAVAAFGISVPPTVRTFNISDVHRRYVR